MKDFGKKEGNRGSIGTNIKRVVLSAGESKKITDHGAEDEAEVDPDIERKYVDEVGVAVVFEDEE